VQVDLHKFPVDRFLERVSEVIDKKPFAKDADAQGGRETDKIPSDRNPPAKGHRYDKIPLPR